MMLLRYRGNCSAFSLEGNTHSWRISGGNSRQQSLPRQKAHNSPHFCGLSPLSALLCPAYQRCWNKLPGATLLYLIQCHIPFLFPAQLTTFWRQLLGQPRTGSPIRLQNTSRSGPPEAIPKGFLPLLCGFGLLLNRPIAALRCVSEDASWNLCH